MDTSDGNRSSPNSEVTPDLVAQKNQEYGLVSEVKRSLSADASSWVSHIEQLRKYDDDLRGWWTPTESVPVSDAALLVHQSRSRAFLKVLERKINEDPEYLTERTAVIEFNRSNEANAYIFFRKEWGAISDSELAEGLDLGVQVPLDKVLRSSGQIQFYDSAPPVPWLMNLLWTDTFASAYDPSAYDEAKQAVPIPVKTSEITQELQKAYGSGALKVDQRSKEFPREIWVRRALDAFVKAKLAIPGGSHGEYVILYRIFRGDVLERFVAMGEAGGNEPTPPKEQIPLQLAPDD